MKKLMFLTLLLSLMAWSGCRPCDDPTNPECPNYCVDETNPECPNYDPCWDALPPVSAAFEMAEIIGRYQRPNQLPGISYTLTDTALADNHVRFRAEQEADSYQWRIGSDPRTFTEREVTLFFPDPTQLTVTLIVKRASRTDCYPEDDGIDTVRRRLVVVPIVQSAIVGDYLGATEQNPGELYTLSFYRRMHFEDSTQFSHISVTNVHPGCNNTGRNDPLRGSPGYREFRYFKDGFDLNTQCFANAVIAQLNESGDSITVWFERFTETEPHEQIEEKFIFRGARVR